MTASPATVFERAARRAQVTGRVIPEVEDNDNAGMCIAAAADIKHALFAYAARDGRHRTVIYSLLLV